MGFMPSASKRASSIRSERLLGFAGKKSGRGKLSVLCFTSKVADSVPGSGGSPTADGRRPTSMSLRQKREHQRKYVKKIRVEYILECSSALLFTEMRFREDLKPLLESLPAALKSPALSTSGTRNSWKNPTLISPTQIPDTIFDVHFIFGKKTCVFENSKKNEVNLCCAWPARVRSQVRVRPKRFRTVRT